MDTRFSRHRPGKLDEQADKTGRQAIEEARMVVRGIQALFGFQLIAVFNERFKRAYGTSSSSTSAPHVAAIVIILGSARPQPLRR